MSEHYELKIRSEKVEIVADMKERLSAQGVVLVTFDKLTVADANLLRRKFLAHGVKYKVIKNTLTRIAADELGLEGLDDLLTGPNGLATCDTDPVAPAAALKEFFEETKSEAVTVKAGVLAGKVIDAAGVKALADLPSREQLLGVLAGTLAAPITNLARALNGNILKFAYALEAVRKQKESA